MSSMLCKSCKPRFEPCTDCCQVSLRVKTLVDWCKRTGGESRIQVMDFRGGKNSWLIWSCGVRHRVVEPPICWRYIRWWTRQVSKIKSFRRTCCAFNCWQFSGGKRQCYRSVRTSIPCMWVSSTDLCKNNVNGRRDATILVSRAIKTQSREVNTSSKFQVVAIKPRTAVQRDSQYLVYRLANNTH